MRFISKLASFAGIALTAGLFMTGTAHAATLDGGQGYGSPQCPCSTQPPVIKFPKPVTPDPRCHYIGADVKGFQPFGNDNCYPKPDPQPVYHFTDNYRQDGWGCQWQDQGNGWHLTGFDSQGRQNDGRDHGSDGWNCDHGIPGHACYKQTVTFLYSHAYGSWLQLVSPQALVPGEILTYDHKTWTVGQWTPHGHGDRPGGDWFILTDAYGHILNGSGNALQTAHTICHPTYKYVA